MKQPHILLGPGDVSKYIILAGDPGRILRLARYMDSYEEIAYNREFRTIRGTYKGVDITATSTGIGAPSAAICMEELIACGGEYFIRIGSGGAVQPHIKVGDLVIATAAVREDGTSRMYVEEKYPAVADFELVNSIINTCRDLGFTYYTGIIRSHDSFYIDNEDELMSYWSRKNVLCSDMESGVIFTLAQLKGVKAASILNTVVEYKTNVKHGIGGYVNEKSNSMEGEKREIMLALETIASLKKISQQG
ncbi:MAG TPA: nucleoside phosphorylase [Tissierellia bacterium]|nr:nucleoside phosphorylase [Tissierellia bacterium]